ncbi:hypothetical protein TWF281_004474 [Arthrobotrys megalospora]
MVCATHLLPCQIFPCAPSYVSPPVRFLMLQGLEHHKAANVINFFGTIDLERLAGEVDSVENRFNFYGHYLNLRAGAQRFRRPPPPRKRACVIS